MEIRVERSVFTENQTLGKMFVGGDFYAYTLEDKDRGLNGDCAKKIKTKTAIDYGRYQVVLAYSNRFKKYLPLLLNVKCFEGILIHGGNSHENTEGCILVGTDGDMKTKIWNCASKVNGLVALLKKYEKKEKIWIEVVKA
ncbi:DUF5675 family protein [Flavobacterium sp. RHBU_24]|uniref:DUF5675 family protein n=1 Tax=Flavobacterium sp. RHBU_24 TaxID=3391185 RepID=UPI003984E32E